jgi:hypothetical protein
VIVPACWSLKQGLSTDLYTGIYPALEQVNDVIDTEAHKVLHWVIERFSTGLRPECQSVIARSEATKQSSLTCGAGGLDCFAALAMTTWASAAPSPKHRPVIPQDHPRRVVSRRAGDAAAGVGAGAAMIQAF